MHANPSVIELRLEGDIFALLLELGAEDLELGGFQRSVAYHVRITQVLSSPSMALRSAQEGLESGLTIQHQQHLVART